jgi:hypothetical protein
MSQAHWIHPVSANFNTAGDWSTGTVPGSADDAILDASGPSPYTVTAAGAITVHSFQTASNAILDITGSFSALNGTGSGVSAGLVQVMDGATLTLQGVVAIPNLLTVNGKTKPTTVVIGAAGVTLEGPFSFSAGNSLGSLILNFEGAHQQIVGATDTSTLTIVNARVSGNGQLGEGKLIINVEAQGFIEAKGLGVLVVNTGAHTITNAGLIDAEGQPSSSLTPIEGLIESPVENTGILEADGRGASLVLQDAVTGAGGRAVITGGLLEFDSAFNQSVTFNGNNGELLLADAQGFNSPVIAFSTIGGESLDFRDIGFVSATEASFSGTSSAGVLTVSDGTHSTSFAMRLGDYLKATFVASSDGDGGVQITTATPVHWLNPVNGDFATSANWSAGSVPGGTDEAILDAAGGSPYAVAVSTSQSIAVIETAADATLNIGAALTDTNGTGSGANAGAIMVGAATLALGGCFANPGTVTLDGSSSGVASLVVAGSGVTLSGGGKIVLGGDRVHDTITGGTPAATLTNADNTIEGGGQLGGGALTVVNQPSGVIDADAGTLTIGAGSRTLINAGILEAIGSGTLMLPGDVISNSAGGKIAAAGGQVQLRGARIVGGALSSSGAGLVWAIGAGNVFDGRFGRQVTLDGEILIANGGSLTLEGAVDNTAVIDIGGRSTTAILLVAGSVTLSGGGRVAFGDSSTNEIVATSSATLTNVDNVITAAGVISGAGLSLVNQAGGVINGWSAATGLVIDTGAHNVVNSGTIISTGGGGIAIDGGVKNSGLLEVTKGVLLVKGAVSGAGEVRIKGGAADFAGSFSESVTFTPDASGVLELADAAAYHGTISGFSKTGTTALDLDDIIFASGSTRASFSGTTASGVLTVTDGTHTAKIALKGDYVASAWSLGSDGHGGTRVVDPTAPEPPLARAMVAAIASFAPKSATLATPDGTVNAIHPMLVAPR